MKNKKTFIYCEYCNKSHEDISPPDSEHYLQGYIQISKDSTVLLNNLGELTSHAKDIGGCYCDINCLSNYVAAIRYKDKK